MRLLRAALPHIRMTRATPAARQAPCDQAPTSGPRLVLPPTPSTYHASAEPTVRHQLPTTTWRPAGAHATLRATPWSRGTWDDPLPIASATSSRLVACTGTGPTIPSAAHTTAWITVRADAPQQCPECGQVFKLTQRHDGDDGGDDDGGDGSNERSRRQRSHRHGLY